MWISLSQRSDRLQLSGRHSSRDDHRSTTLWWPEVSSPRDFHAGHIASGWSATNFDFSSIVRRKKKIFSIFFFRIWFPRFSGTRDTLIKKRDCPVQCGTDDASGSRTSGREGKTAAEPQRSCDQPTTSDTSAFYCQQWPPNQPSLLVYPVDNCFFVTPSTGLLGGRTFLLV